LNARLRSRRVRRITRRVVTMWKRCAALVVVLGIAAAVEAGAAERKIQMKDLPPPVRDAVQRETKDATVKALAEETTDGKTLYEVETEVNRHARDLLFDATGKLVEVEEETTVGAAPAAVKAALEQHGKIVKLETVTKGPRVTYEAVVEKSGKKSEVAVDAEGKPVPQ
jgi:uncharacterized membrane protein YkoI